MSFITLQNYNIISYLQIKDDIILSYYILLTILQCRIHCKKATFAYTIIKIITMELKVKEVIKAKGLTMQQVADVLGITRDTLTRNINGNPTIETLEKIAKVLGTSVSDLLDEERPEEDKNTITCPNCGKKFKMEE